MGRAKTPPEPVEVAQARAGLDALPPLWVTDDFRTAVLAYATQAGARRMLSERHSAAQQHRATAHARLAGGDTSAVEDLVTASGDVLAAEYAASAVAPAVFDDATLTEPLTRVDQALAEAAASLDLTVHDYETDRAQWTSASRSGQRLIPPEATDADRAVSTVLAATRAEVERWKAGMRVWSADRHRADPVSMLAAAAAYLDTAADLAVRVTDTNTRVCQANTARRAEGLSWTPTRIGVT